jgi:hypothetical protein
MRRIESTKSLIFVLQCTKNWDWDSVVAHWLITWSKGQKKDLKVILWTSHFFRNKGGQQFDILVISWWQQLDWILSHCACESNWSNPNDYTIIWMGKCLSTVFLKWIFSNVERSSIEFWFILVLFINSHCRMHPNIWMLTDKKIRPINMFKFHTYTATVLFSKIQRLFKIFF